MIALTLLSSPAMAGPNVGAILRPEVVVDLASDRIGEDGAAIHTWVSAFARDETPRGDAWFLEGRMQHHAMFGEDIEAWYEFGLGESGWDGRVGGPESPVRLRIGALRERWGKLDLLPILDVLNPIDARTGTLIPAAWQRNPLPMAVVQIGTGRLRSETVVIPFAGADQLWLRETDWSLARQGMIPNFFASTTLWEGEDDEIWDPLVRELSESARGLDPSTRRVEDAATNLTGLPRALAANGEIAQRFELRGSSYDLALMGGLLRSTFPMAVLDEGLRQAIIDEVHPGLEDLLGIDLDGDDEVPPPILVGDDSLVFTWPRTTMVGLEGSALVGPLQIRGESAWFSDRVVRLPYADATTLPSLSAGLGVDYSRGSTFMASLEARWQHLFDAPEQMVFSLEDQVQIAAGVRGTLAADRVAIQIGGSFDLTYAELYLRPTVSWRATDVLQFEAGAVILEGFRHDAPGSNLLDSLTYEGGPASFWSQNDSLTFAVICVL